MKPISYLAVYKDSPKTPARYFASFVSESVADQFLAELPEPQQGGWKRKFTIQPFTANEVSLIKKTILSNRA